MSSFARSTVTSSICPGASRSASSSATTRSISGPTMSMPPMTWRRWHRSPRSPRRPSPHSSSAPILHCSGSTGSGNWIDRWTWSEISSTSTICSGGGSASRKTPASWLLTVPRVLRREPHDFDGAGRYEFPYREDVSGPGADRYLWGPAVYAYAGVLVQAFQRHGWLEDIRGTERGRDGGGLVAGLPTPAFRCDPARIAPRGSTDLNIDEELDRELRDLGFLPLCHCPGTTVLGIPWRGDASAPRRLRSPDRDRQRQALGSDPRDPQRLPVRALPQGHRARPDRHISRTARAGVDSAAAG